MTGLIVKTVLWAIPVLIVLYFAVRWLYRWTDRWLKEIQKGLPWVPPSSIPRDNTYLRPEVYAIPTFRVRELLGLVKNPDYPARDTALGYVGQYFSKDYARPDKYFEKVAVKLVTDAAVQKQAWDILEKYCGRFGKRSLLKKAGKLRQEARKDERDRAAAKRTAEVLLILDQALNDGKRVEVAGKRMASFKECIEAVMTAGKGETVEIVIGQGKSAVSFVVRP